LICFLVDHSVDVDDDVEDPEHLLENFEKFINYIMETISKLKKNTAVFESFAAKLVNWTNKILTGTIIVNRTSRK
jgi:hypothetical protein